MGTEYTAVNEETKVGYELGKGSWIALDGISTDNIDEVLLKIMGNYSQRTIDNVKLGLAMLGDCKLSIHADSGWSIIYKPGVFIIGSIWDGIQYNRDRYKCHLRFYQWKKEVQHCITLNQPIPIEAIEYYNELSGEVR
jgi:hypothetical protein